MIPILINTKGRAGKTRTTALLDEAGLDYTLVVEPKEEAAYREAASPRARIAVLPKNDGGLAFSREFARRVGEAEAENFVILDDDIITFRRVRDGKTMRADANVLSEASEFFKCSGLAMMSFEYVQYAWSQRKEVSLWKPCDCCVFFNRDRIRNAHFEYGMNMKGDRDFCIQVAALGQRFGRLNTFAIEVPFLGTNSCGGGLCDDYRSKRDEQESFLLAKKWGPRIVTIVRRKGRIDARINVKPFIGE